MVQPPLVEMTWNDPYGIIFCSGTIFKWSEGYNLAITARTMLNIIYIALPSAFVVVFVVY